MQRRITMQLIEVSVMDMKDSVIRDYKDNHVAFDDWYLTVSLCAINLHLPYTLDGKAKCELQRML